MIRKVVCRTMIAAFLVMLVVQFNWAQPDYAPKWLICGSVEAGNLDSEKQAQFRVLGTTLSTLEGDTKIDLPGNWTQGRIVKGEQRFRLPSAQTRWGVAKGDLILATRLPGNTQPFQYQVQINDREVGRWEINPVPLKGWQSHYFIIPRAVVLKEGGEMPEFLQISLRSDLAVVYRHSLYTADFAYLTNLRAGSVASQRLTASEMDLMRGIENIGLNRWREATVFLSQAARSEVPEVARSARYWLRYAVFRLKTPRSYYRAGLYAYVHGWYEDAVQAFYRALQEQPNHPDILYHLALAKEYRGDPVQQTVQLFSSSAALYQVPNPNLWRVLVVIYLKAKSEKGEILEMNPEEVDKVIQKWKTVEVMTAAASRGHFRLETTLRILPDDNLYPLVSHGGMLLAPPDAIINTWGEYDSVISVRPGGPAVAAGADVGPNGAAVSDIGPWANWEVFLHEWNHQFDWTSIVSEVGTGYPVTHDSDLCGMQPIPTMGAGHRNSMRYYFSAAMYRRLRAAAPHGGTLLNQWSLSHPEPFTEERLNPQTVLTPPEVFPFKILQDNDFHDLTVPFGVPTEGRLIYARCYIYSPKDQEVRMRLGMNDTMRVWLNGRVIYRGAYTGAVKWENTNLPDMINAWASLKQGWNEFILAVVHYKGGWGYSVRLTDYKGEPLQNLQISADPPRAKIAQAVMPRKDKLYRWRDVKEDFTEKLPRLTETDLRKITGYPELTITAKTPEYVILDYGSASPPAGARKWDGANANEQELNNRLNMAQGEMLAAVRSADNEQKKEHKEDILFMRLEAMELYLPILRDRAVERQILGYIYLQDGSSPRCLLVAKAQLGDYPYEEAGLLEP